MRRLRAILTVTAMFGVFVVLSAAQPAADLKPIDGKVTGAITVAGAPLAKGRVFFHSARGQFVGSKVEEGRFEVDRVPVGVHAVTIEGDGVPARYTFDDKSGLVVAVNAEANTIDFKLQ